MEAEAREARHTDIGIGVAPETPGSDLIPEAVSERSELPDFRALIEAEISEAEEAANRTHGALSSLGVGELVLSARELSGLSQRQLASRTGTSQPAVAVMESGKRVPTVRTLMRLVEAAGFELVVGLRRPGHAVPVALGALLTNIQDGLVDYEHIRALSPFEGPTDPDPDR
ncbi:MAG: helix-turn-helix domain-containing protein [Actinomycetota bacterium]